MKNREIDVSAPHFDVNGRENRENCAGDIFGSLGRQGFLIVMWSGVVFVATIFPSMQKFTRWYNLCSNNDLRTIGSALQAVFFECVLFAIMWVPS